MSPAVAADSPWLYGIHWWGYTSGQVVDGTPAAMLDCPTYGGWDLETVLTHSASWWGAAHFAGLYQNLYNRNVSIITRIDYDWGQTVPSPTNPNYANWPNSCVSVVNTLRNYCHIWQIGNEPNILGEGNAWPNNQITPAGYAQIYRNVRNAIRGSAQVGPPGPHRVLIAAASPGGVIPGVRWIDGNQWLGQVIDNIPHDEIDGFAIHAYGGSVNDFRVSFISTLATIDAKGLQDRPVYMTEWNRYSDPGSSSAEAAAAQFLRDAFIAVNTWNQTVGNHNIVCMCWFIYDANQQAGGAWNGYAIEYWRNNGNPLGDPKNLFTAYEQTVDLRYPAGVEGRRGIQAAFSASTTVARVATAIQFTDESTGTVNSWSWTFGDGGTSTQQSPAHAYDEPGLYTVSLTATGPSGSDTETKVDYLRILPRPGDFDGDHDADQEDFGAFQRCLTGPSVPQYDPECLAARLDHDIDVDSQDAALFLLCYSGPNVPSAPDCIP